MDKQKVIEMLTVMSYMGFEVIKSNSGQIAINDKKGTAPCVLMNDMDYLTPTPHQWHLIETEIKRLKELQK